MTNTSAPLPKASHRDRRTATQRLPRVPVTVWVQTHGEQGQRKVHTAVGVGGWAGDARNAAARALDIPGEEVAVVFVQGGHA